MVALCYGGRISNLFQSRRDIGRPSEPLFAGYFPCLSLRLQQKQKQKQQKTNNKTSVRERLEINNIIIILLLFSYASDSSNTYGSTSNAFIFSLSNSERLGPFKSMVNIPSQAIFKKSTLGPTFGGGHDIMIADDAYKQWVSSTEFGHSYSVPNGVQNRKKVLAGTRSFSPNKIEVFYLP